MANFQKYNETYGLSHNVKTLKEISLLCSTKLDINNIKFNKCINKPYSYEVTYEEFDGTELAEYIIGYCDEILTIVSIEEEIELLSKSINNDCIDTEKCSLIWNLLSKSEQDTLTILNSCVSSSGDLLHTDITKKLIRLKLVTPFVVKDNWDNYALTYLGAPLYKYKIKQPN